MNPTGFTLILASLLGAALSGTGAYLIIDNLVQPQGLLFEGIVMLGLGAILILLIVVAAALGKTMITFADIMTKQAEIQREMRSYGSNTGASTIPVSPLNSLIKNIMENPQNYTFRPGGTVSIFTEAEEQADSFSGMTIEELEKELSDAIKNDDYETADEINKEIKKRRGDEDDKKNDE